MKSIYKICSVLMVLLVLSTSCDDFFDVNKDPNNPSTADITLVFPSGVATVAFALGGQYQILGEFWSQHWTQSPGANQYAPVDDYNVLGGYNTQYTQLYQGALADLNYVSKNAEATENWNYFLMSEVTQAYVFQFLVDLYNQIPYSEALKGADDPNPKFDDGQDVYDDLILRIDNALSKDRSVITSKAPGKDDLVFKGDMNKWVQFANTLKLKIFMRQSEARPAVAQSGIEALFTSGAEFLNSDAQMSDYVDVQNFRNPFYETQIATTGRGYVDVAASTTLLNFLSANGDPRLTKIYRPSITGNLMVGSNQGDYNSAAFATSKNLAQPLISATHPAVFMSKAESKFLQAEAVERYGVAGNATQLYHEGIDASFAKLGASGASALYAAGQPYEYNDGIEDIIVQKWVAMANFQGVEAYLERLRTGFPDFFTTTPHNVTGGIFPARLPYPSTEISNNIQSVVAVGGQKQVTQKVWWDTL